MGYPWSTSADIWSTGGLTFEYLRRVIFFTSLHELKNDSPLKLHFARIPQISVDSK